jgi:2-dehydropantoate 2-reductase
VSGEASAKTDLSGITKGEAGLSAEGGKRTRRRIKKTLDTGKALLYMTDSQSKKSERKYVMGKQQDKMSILFVGAGVIGSIYAAKMAHAGHDITVLARGKRLENIRQPGIVLKNDTSGQRMVMRVKTRETLGGEEAYDLIIVAVRSDQVGSILPVLAADKKSPAILFMVNNPMGYEKWIEAVGRKRTLIGFPGAGGGIKGAVVNYTLVPGWMQPTTIGELDGAITPRVKRISAVMISAGFPVSICENMDAWQKYHVAFITPCSFAIYHALNKGRKLSESKESVILMEKGIQEGFRVLRSLGVPVTPAKLKALELIPERVLIKVILWWAGTRQFDMVAVRHSLNAKEEMEVLAAKFMQLAQKSDVQTPVLDLLYHGLVREVLQAQDFGTMCSGICKDGGR